MPPRSDTVHGAKVALPFVLAPVPPHVSVQKGTLAVRCRQARTLLGYRDAVPCLEALRRTAEWLAAHPPDDAAVHLNQVPVPPGHGSLLCRAPPAHE